MATRSKALEQLLTDANESAKAFAQFGGDLAAVRMRLLVTEYGRITAKLVDKLQVDAAGRILVNESNATVQAAIKKAGELFQQSATQVMSDLSTAGVAVAESIGKTSGTLRRMLTGTLIDEAVVESFVADSLAYGKVTYQRTSLRIAAGMAERVNSIVTDALARFEGNKADLISKLFSPQGLEAFRQSNDRMRSWAMSMAGKGKEYIEQLKAGSLDIVKIRDTYKKEVSDYIAQRKSFLESGGTPSLFEDTVIEKRTISDVKQQIMETHQDSINRTASNVLPVSTLWANAKNTGHVDNCIDAMEADPMTLDEWRDSPFGLPRSPSRDCGIYCECLLFPVTGTIDGKDLSVEVEP